MYRRLPIILVIGVITLNACGSGTPSTPTPDVIAIYTSAAQTVVAELTQTASVFTSTPEATSTETSVPPQTTPLVTHTPQPPPTLVVEASPTMVICNDAQYVSDINVPDGTQMSPGQDFIKTWRIKNSGTCSWGAGYRLVYGYGSKLDGQPVAFTTTVNPGEEVDVSIQFKAPDKVGEYVSTWRVADSGGNPFGDFFYVKISVR